MSMTAHLVNVFAAAVVDVVNLGVAERLVSESGGQVEHAKQHALGGLDGGAGRLAGGGRQAARAGAGEERFWQRVSWRGRVGFGGGGCDGYKQSC